MKRLCHKVLAEVSWVVIIDQLERVIDHPVFKADVSLQSKKPATIILVAGYFLFCVVVKIPLNEDDRSSFVSTAGC